MKYNLRLKAGFPASRRVRAGIEIPAGTGVDTELTDDQLKAMKSDPEIVIREADAAAPKKAAPKKAPAKTAAPVKQMVDEQEEKQA